MNKQILTNTKTGDDPWRFHIKDLSPVFKEVRDGIFKKIADPDVYTCDDEYNNLAGQYISDGAFRLCVVDEEPLIAPPKRYTIEDGRFMVYESRTKSENGELISKEFGRPITDSFYMVIDTDVEFDDGLEKIHKYRGRIIVDNGANEFKFDVDSRLFATPQDMAKILSNIGGAKVVFDNNNLKDIRIAMQRTSKYESRKVSQVFGWQNKNVYQSQSAMIFRGVVNGGDSNVDLSDIGIAKNLDIIAISDKEFKIVGDHICKDLMHVHERYPIDCLFGFTFLAPIASQIVGSNDWNGGRIGMWLVGGSGCGKTYAALLFQNFFGNFGGDKATFSWLGTPYSIQEGGYFFKDALFMVDDFKIAHFSQSSFDSVVMILQNYADSTSRTRLGADMNLKEGKPIRGSLLITGEDVLDDVGSVMARYHIVEMDDAYKNREAGRKTKEYKKFYSGFMGRYIAWLITDPKHVSRIVNRIEKIKDEFIGDRSGANIDRVAQSFAYNLVGFETFCRFLVKNDFISNEKMKKMVKTHKNNLFLHIDKNVRDVREATVSEIFMSTLRDLINSGAVKIHDVENERPPQYGGKNEYIGFDDLDGYIYFFGTNVWNAVNDASGRLMNSKSNLIGELVKRGIMLPHMTRDGEIDANVYRKNLYGKTQVTWRILKSALGYDEEEVTEEDIEGW